jgi:hypothetical protein
MAWPHLTCPIVASAGFTPTSWPVPELTIGRIVILVIDPGPPG